MGARGRTLPDRQHVIFFIVNKIIFPEGEVAKRSAPDSE